jgi:cell division protein ZapA
MPKIDVILGGRTYPVVCGEGEQAHVLELAGAFDGILRRVSQGAQGATDAQLLVLAALMMTDKVYEMESETDNLRGDVRALEAQLAEMRQEMDALRSGAVSPEEQAEVTAAVEHLTRRVEVIAARVRSA